MNARPLPLHHLVAYRDGLTNVLRDYEFAVTKAPTHSLFASEILRVQQLDANDKARLESALDGTPYTVTRFTRSGAIVGINPEAL